MPASPAGSLAELRAAGSEVAAAGSSPALGTWGQGAGDRGSGQHPCSPGPPQNVSHPICSSRESVWESITPESEQAALKGCLQGDGSLVFLSVCILHSCLHFAS